MGTAAIDPVVLQLDGVTKRFPGVRALDRVSFTVRAGEVHGLVGENGAGKSTLMAVASGALAADEGTVMLCGQAVRGDPEQARELGLAIVRQEPALMPDLSVTENLYLGVPRRCRPPIGRAAQWAATLLARWNDEVRIDPRERVATLGPEQRFIVEIVKALAAEPRLLVLDEPTEHLLGDDVARLFARIREVTARGAAVVYISHRIREVQQIADQLTVLRTGQGQGSYAARSLSEQQIVELIVGGQLDREFPAKREARAPGVDALRLEGLSGPGFSGVDLRVASGEIVGLAGIDGNGQRELLRALAGMAPSRGRVCVGAKEVALRNPGRAADAGIRLLPGDRHREGIFGELSVRENFSLRSLSRDLRAGLLARGSELRRTEEAVRQFAVKTPDTETPIASLSGGNQQKLVLASVLASRPAVLLVDEPTQGVDIGARMEIYRSLRATAASGVGLLVVSSDAHEVAGLCDRVLIFSRGQVAAELAADAVTEHGITAAVLTATTVRERAHGGVSGFWKWAAGDVAPIAMLLLAVLLLGAYAASVNEFYLTGRNWGGVLPLIATLALVAFGQQVLMLVGGIDLSVGPLMGLIVVVQSFFLVADASAGQQALGWALVLVISLAIGFLNWLLVDPAGLHPMVATLATYMVVQAVSLLLRPVSGGLIADEIMEGIGAGIGFVPLAILAVAALALALEFGLFRTRLGLALRGFGSRPEAARVAGVHPRRTRMAAYMACSFFAGLAAILMMAQTGSGDASAGLNYTLASIAAVVIGGASLFGGRGSFVGALLGALLITQVNVVTAFLGLSDAWQSYLLGAMIVASVALYSKSRDMAVAR